MHNAYIRLPYVTEDAPVANGANHYGKDGKEQDETGLLIDMMGGGGRCLLQTIAPRFVGYDTA